MSPPDKDETDPPLKDILKGIILDSLREKFLIKDNISLQVFGVLCISAEHQQWGVTIKFNESLNTCDLQGSREDIHLEKEDATSENRQIIPTRASLDQPKSHRRTESLKRKHDDSCDQNPSMESCQSVISTNSKELNNKKTVDSLNVNKKLKDQYYELKTKSLESNWKESNSSDTLSTRLQPKQRSLLNKHTTQQLLNLQPQKDADESLLIQNSQLPLEQFSHSHSTEGRSLICSVESSAENGMSIDKHDRTYNSSDISKSSASKLAEDKSATGGSTSHTLGERGAPGGCTSHTLSERGAPCGSTSHTLNDRGAPGGSTSHTLNERVAPGGSTSHTLSERGAPGGSTSHTLINGGVDFAADRQGGSSEMMPHSSAVVKSEPPELLEAVSEMTELSQLSEHDEYLQDALASGNENSGMESHILPQQEVPGVGHLAGKNGGQGKAIVKVELEDGCSIQAIIDTPRPKESRKLPQENGLEGGTLEQYELSAIKTENHDFDVGASYSSCGYQSNSTLDGSNHVPSSDIFQDFRTMDYGSHFSPAQFQGGFLPQPTSSISSSSPSGLQPMRGMPACMAGTSHYSKPSAPLGHPLATYGGEFSHADIVSHVLTSGSRKVWACEHCGKVYQWRPSYKKHVKSCVKNKG